ncbi:unnamed protein product [Echinostoma caproni]|uniref:DUF7041 domain-containing protein n=1 Tax=Echinostoma caproni TaxID=27848 RepID=A0A183B2I2_9TREM|nr:unnamed protein product [Echinostoma caproni]
MFTQFFECKENGVLAALEDTSVLGLQARLPEFKAEDPEFWLAQVEAQFRLATVTIQIAKFTQLIGQLPRSLAPGLRDTVCNPPPDRTFDALRDAILGRFGMPFEFRLKQLLGGLRLTDNGLDTTTKLLSYMQGQIASLNVDENIVCLSWVVAWHPNY